MKRVDETGSVEPGQIGGYKPKAISGEHARFKALVRFKTLAAAQAAVKVSRSCRFITLSLALRGNGSVRTSMVSGTL